MGTKITFVEWVKKSGRKKALIAKDLKIELTSLYRYLSGDRVPSKDVMGRILAASDGQVDPACFYAPKPEAESPKVVA